MLSSFKIPIWSLFFIGLITVFIASFSNLTIAQSKYEPLKGTTPAASIVRISSLPSSSGGQNTNRMVPRHIAPQYSAAVKEYQQQQAKSSTLRATEEIDKSTINPNQLLNKSIQSIQSITLNENFQGITQTNYAPPDPVICSGTNYVLEAVNLSFAIFNKTGTKISQTDFSTFFGSLATNDTLSDPKIIYDQYSQRFVILVLDYNATAKKSAYLIAASQSSDPTGLWYKYSSDATLDGSNSTTNGADYPGLGYDNQAVYLTSNQYSSYLLGSFQYAKIRILNKSQLYSGQSLTYNDFVRMSDNYGTVMTIKPAHHFGTTSSAYLMNTEPFGASSVTLWRIDNPISSPTLTLQATVGVASYSSNYPYDLVPQKGSSIMIEGNDCETQDVIWRNGFLYTAFADLHNWGSDTVEAVHYVKINSSTNSTVIDAVYGDDGYYYTYPNIYVDAYGDIAMVFSRSSSSEYAGVRWTYRTQSDGAASPSQSLQDGLSAYTVNWAMRNGDMRWGDYSGICLDAGSDNQVWFCGEWAASSSSWSTQIGSFRFAPVQFANQDQNGSDLGGNLLVNSTLSISSQTKIGFEPNSNNSVKTLASGSVNSPSDRFGSQKHNSWNTPITSYLLSNSFSAIDAPNQIQKGSFLPLNSATINASSAEGIALSNVNVQFNDPWYMNSNGTQGNNFAQSIIPITQTSAPMTGAYNQASGGVFTNQRYDIPGSPYYSVGFPSQSVSVGGTNYPLQLSYWTANGANIQNSTAAQTGIEFTSSSATVTANVKGVHLSNDATAFANNSQRRLIETQSGGATWLHQIYTSLGHVWIEHSSDNGNTWILGNNGQPLDGSAGGKNPSIAYTYNSVNNDYNYIGVVWQQPSGSNYTICGEMFNQSIPTSDVPHPVTATTTIFTEPSDAYSVNANPNLVLTSGAWGPYFITFERKSTSGSLQPGINWLVGYIGQGDGGWDGSFGSVESSGIVSGTDANTTNVQMSVDPLYGNYANTVAVNLIQQENSPGLIYSHYLYLNDNGTWSYSQYDDGVVSYNSNINLAPSITSLVNNYYSACWIESYQLVYFSLGFDVRYYYGNFVTSCSINRGGSDSSSSGFAVWSQEPNFSGPYSNESIRFYNGSPNSSTIQTLSTAGQYVQAGNGAGLDLSNMYVSAFYPFTLPYYFSTSGALTPLSKGNSVMAEGRGFVIDKGDSSFSYSFGNLNVDGKYIGFVAAPDTSNYGDINILSNALVTEPFQINTNSKVSFTEQSGFADSAAAVKALGKNGYINYKIELIDNATGSVLGTIKDVDINSSNVYGMKDPSYSLSTVGLLGKTVKAEIILETNLAYSEYSPDENSVKFLQNDKIPAAIRNGRKNVPHSNIILTKSLTDVNPALTSKVSTAEQLTLQESNVIKTYALDQNYPNPFNPTTVINYQIPNNNYVTLKVYDILGNVVKTLVDGYKAQGKYSVNFNASNLASGVYFYRIQSGSYTSTKKMLLLK